MDKQVMELINIYKKAQQEIIRTIAEKEARGNITFYQRSLLKQVNSALAELDKNSKEWVNIYIPQYYTESLNQTNKELEALGININTSFAKLHKDAIEIILRNCYGDLHDANMFVGRRITDAVRQAGIDAVGQKFAQGQTVKECKKHLIQALIDSGIDGIKDKRGRLISLSSYGETVARSTTTECTNRATMNQLTSLGLDLVKMTSHNSSCPICAPLEGRVYSLTGNTPGYPTLSYAFDGEYANIHPNCRHRLAPYIPELADDPVKDKEFSNRPFDIDERAQKQVDIYKKVQKEKRKMRSDMDQWQRYQLAIPDLTPKTFSAFRRMKYSNSSKYQELESEYKSFVVK